MTLLRSLIAPLAALVFAFISTAQAEEKRLALLIGNGAYRHVPALRNPTNDSSDLAVALRDVGFEVIQHTDQGQAAMLDTLREFRRTASGADIALIYYAGHGIEIDRQNYLIPVDAELQTYADINFEAVPLETMIFAAEGASRLSMVIVDACRNNPFAASIQQGNSTRSIGRGLSAVEPSKNTLVAYAAKEGTTAADGEGRNSPYAAALISSLQEPGLEVGLMMRQVRDAVLDQTNGQQEPFVYGSLSAERIFLNQTRAIAPVELEELEVQSALLPTNEDQERAAPEAGAAEIAFWQSIAGTTVPSELQSYLAAYPDGLFADLARSRLARLGPAPVPAVPEDPFKPLVPQPEIEPEVAEETLHVPRPQRDLTRDEIRNLQMRLSMLGYEPGRADGLAGPRTLAAIRAFEESADLPVEGSASLSVLSALQDRVSDNELKAWQAKQARAATLKAVPRKPRAALPARPNATPPKPQVAAPAAAPKLSAGDRQFCNAHKICRTRQCRSGGDEGWRPTQECRFCPLWVQKCG